MLVVPKPAPVTVPEVFTVAMEAEAVPQVPPVVASVRVVVPPKHTLEEPLIDATAGVAVTLKVIATPADPQLLLTV